MTVMKKRLLFLVLTLCALPAAAQFLPVEPNPYGERAVIIPVPDEVCGNPADIITLDSWYYRHDAGEGVYLSGKGIVRPEGETACLQNEGSCGDAGI